MRFDKRTGILMFKPPISADVHCVFWAANADTVPALSPAFSRANGLGREFFVGFGTGIVTNLKRKIPSQITGKIMLKPTGLFYSYRLFTGNL